MYSDTYKPNDKNQERERMILEEQIRQPTPSASASQWAQCAHQGVQSLTFASGSGSLQPPDFSTMEQIKQLQSNFYSNTDKNIFFKNNQKNQCATEISNQMNLQDLLDETMYIIPDTNKVFFNYAVFKLYANPQNYEDVVLNVLKLFRECIQKYNCFEIHVDLKTFTISAATRYMILIQSFCNECLKSTTEFSVLATNLFIYNTPGMMDQISQMLKPFLHINMRHKIIFFSKNESPAKIDRLHSAILNKPHNVSGNIESNSFA
jgi:hypothetical protein